LADECIDNNQEQIPRRTGRLRRIALGIVLGTAIGLVGGLAVLMATRGEQLPEVTYAVLDDAKMRWEENGPRSYDLEIEQSGVNPGKVQVEIRDGVVTQAFHNGRPLKRHSWDDWSVPGLFGIIRLDLDVCAKEAKQNPGGRPSIFSRGRFDAKLGYPVIYRRMTPSGQDAEWKMVKFVEK
jgi:hypothetical protein